MGDIVFFQEAIERSAAYAEGLSGFRFIAGMGLIDLFDMLPCELPQIGWLLIGSVRIVLSIGDFFREVM